MHPNAFGILDSATGHACVLNCQIFWTPKLLCKLLEPAQILQSWSEQFVFICSLPYSHNSWWGHEGSDYAWGSCLLSFNKQLAQICFTCLVTPLTTLSWDPEKEHIFFWKSEQNHTTGDLVILLAPLFYLFCFSLTELANNGVSISTELSDHLFCPDSILRIHAA